jgi:membrane dipeptidase
MTKISRRGLLRAGAAVAAATAFPMINKGRYRVFAASDQDYSQRAIDLVQRSLVIDMLAILHPLDNLFPNPPTENVLAITPEHMEKIRGSGIDVWHPAVGIAGPHVYSDCLRFVAGLNAVVAEYPDDLQRVDGISDFEQIRGNGKIGVIIGIQNSDHFRTPDDVNHFHNLGQRVSQLTYNAQNLIGSGSTERVDGGVSDFGAAIIDRMNRVGMAVDTSHCGDRTTLDAMDISSKPVLITHSNARVLADGHPRTKPDEAIVACAKTGGVVGITGVRQFVSHKEPTNIESLLDHYDHVAKIAGVEHVGIGSDMDPDGYDDMSPELGAMLRSGYKATYRFRDKIDTDGFDHPQRVFDLTDGLIRRSYSDANIEAILGGNFRRALGEIWTIGGQSS